MEEGTELRPLTEAEAEMVAAWPLPAGTPDTVVSKAQLEIGLGASQTTISAWLRKGLPFEEEGTNGRSYKFRLSVAFAWVERMRAEEQGARAAGDAAVAQLQLSLLGGESAAASGGKMSLADQRKLIELEMQRTAAARERRELVRRAEMVVAFEEVFAAIRDANDALPDRLARELGIGPREIEIVERACDDTMHAARLAVRRVIGDDAGEGGDD